MTPDETATSVARRFNAAMKRLGLGVRVEIRAGRIGFREQWEGAGMDAVRILTTTPAYQRGQDSWLGPFIEEMTIVMLDAKKRPE